MESMFLKRAHQATGNSFAGQQAIVDVDDISDDEEDSSGIFHMASLARCRQDGCGGTITSVGSQESCGKLAKGSLPLSVTSEHQAKRLGAHNVRNSQDALAMFDQFRYTGKSTQSVEKGRSSENRVATPAKGSAPQADTGQPDKVGQNGSIGSAMQADASAACRGLRQRSFYSDADEYEAKNRHGSEQGNDVRHEGAADQGTLRHLGGDVTTMDNVAAASAQEQKSPESILRFARRLNAGSSKTRDKGKRRKLVMLSDDEDEDGGERGSTPDVVDVIPGLTDVDKMSDETFAYNIQQYAERNGLLCDEAGAVCEEVIEVEEDYVPVPADSMEDQKQVWGPRPDPLLSTLEKAQDVAAVLRAELASSEASEFGPDDQQSCELISEMEVAAACGSQVTGLVLKPYQLVGVNFMLLLHRINIGGMILADEMGLGKTAQAICFLAVLAHLEADRGPHLVVCPASLLDNWQRELSAWCPHLPVMVLHGSGKEDLRRMADDAGHGGQAPFGVLLTTYSIFERDNQTQRMDRQFLRRWSWSCVIMDEAHLLKDSSSTRVRKLRYVVKDAQRRIMLTGTPLQNDLKELWSLLSFILPSIFTVEAAGLLDDLKRSRGGPVEEGNEDVVAAKLADVIERLKQILSPFMLRRVKADVLQQMVAKDQMVERLQMTAEQASLYQTAMDGYRDRVATRGASTSSSGSGAKPLGGMSNREISGIFSHLRKLANHPLLVRRLYSDANLDSMAAILHREGAFGDECSVERVRAELGEYSDHNLHQLCSSHPQSLESRKLPDSHALASGKAQFLAELLPQLHRRGSRPLIFSQWTSILDILEWVLDALGLSYVRLDGGTQVGERQALVDRYNSSTDIFAFLLTTRAGGQGLNLTGADTVILHDIDFNPQVDRQAEDRCHRIGQTRKVTVYRLICTGTVDESIHVIAERKRNLDAALLNTNAGAEARTDESRTMAQILSGLLARTHRPT